MDISIVLSRATRGIEAPQVRVETHLSGGLPAFTLVGLPETAVRESRERVRSAILNSHLEFPQRRITVNLSPADLPKEGGRFDLPIALGILVADGQLPAEGLVGGEFLGELALDGELRPVNGAIAAAQATAACDRTLYTAPGSAAQAALDPGARVVAADNLLQLCAHLNGRAPIAPQQATPLVCSDDYPNLSSVVGQSGPRRGLEIAAAGSHNLLFYGPPGSGKTLLARCLPGLLPTPSVDELLPTLSMQNLANANSRAQLRRPFRAPHHSASAAALVGGGSYPRPGEISLAHGGVLFLDELPEFSSHVLNMLRQPLEEGSISLVRARQRATYPSRFQLVAAMNPCPCGYYGDSGRTCRCSPDQIQRYQGKVSGPLLDRIDLHVPVQRIPLTDSQPHSDPEQSSAAVRERVALARERQYVRQYCSNADLHHASLDSHCRLSDDDHKYLADAAESLKLSLRTFHRVQRVARTIADLAASDTVERPHLTEALSFRDRW